MSSGYENLKMKRKDTLKIDGSLKMPVLMRQNAGMYLTASPEINVDDEHEVVPDPPPSPDDGDSRGPRPCPWFCGEHKAFSNGLSRVSAVNCSTDGTPTNPVHMSTIRGKSGVLIRAGKGGAGRIRMVVKERGNGKGRGRRGNARRSEGGLMGNIIKGKTFNMTGKPLKMMPEPNLHSWNVCANALIAFFQTSTTVPTFAAYSFTLSQVTQASSWTSVFDQYRINLIEFYTQPRDSITFGAVNPGEFVSVLDFDDATALVAVADALDYENNLTGNMTTGHSWRFTPHVANALYSGAFTSFGNTIAPWIDAASPTVQHYGVKLAASSTDIVYTQDIYVRFHLEFRSAR